MRAAVFFVSVVGLFEEWIGVQRLVSCPLEMLSGNEVPQNGDRKS